MSKEVRDDDRFVAERTSLPGRVDGWLGEGAQGTVFVVEVAGARMALKWYHPAAATTEQWRLLQQIVHAGVPHPAFLWPLDVVRIPGREGFGYLMPLRPENYVPLSALMTRQADASFSAIAEAGRQLAHAFLQLHARGFCYRDISFGNIFFEPEAGDILIADNDNVMPDGSGAAGILGTPRFMAPEIVMGEALPGIQTDLYALSVVLFYLLMLHHPLEGRREAAIHSLDLPAMVQLYGRDPLFIFDPVNAANAPVPELHENALTFWPMYPAFVRDLFVRAFTDGLRMPARRVRETEWRAAMGALKDLTFPCPTCAAENLHPEPFTAAGLTCWQCRRPVPRPLGLRFRHHVVLLARNRTIDARVIDAVAPFELNRPFGEVVLHPERPELLGLKNLSNEIWRCQLAGKEEEQSVPPGRSVALLPGTRFQWTEEAEVCIV